MNCIIVGVLRVVLVIGALAGFSDAAKADLQSDVEFARVGDVSLTLDAFVPDGPGPFPTCILVHGGGFTRGDKQTYIKPLFEPLGRAGFTWFSINYRLAPAHRWPACAQDVETAVRWVRQHAAKYKVDPRRIALIGESAGGHLVSYAGTRATGETSVAVVVPIYAPHDLEFQVRERQMLGDSMKALLGLSELDDNAWKTLREASPSSYVRKAMPPYLLIHGDADATVPYQQSIRFQQQMKAAGNTCDLVTVAGGVHGMGGWEKLGSDYQQRLIAWLKKNMPADSQSNSPAAAKTTYTYKTVAGLPIKADVYRTGDATKRPVVVWIHGGALINGHREAIDRRLIDPCLAEDWTVVSVDYRLAPETRLPEVVQDVVDACVWVREQGPKLFGADPNRIAVCGGSAGGYLTLSMGHRVSPRPVALVSLWGYGDLVGSWYSQPSPHARHHTSKLSAEEALRQVAGSPISDSRDRQGNGGAFYQYCRQQGVWPRMVSGWDPHSEPQKFFPYMPLKNVTADYPPTLLIHGQEDTDVPHEQSTAMAAELQKHQVPHRLISIPQAEHGLAGADPTAVADAYRAAVSFLRERLTQK